MPRFTAAARSRKCDVAGTHLAPSIDNGDHRPAQEFLAAQAHLLGTLAMRETANVVAVEPARAAQRGGRSDGAAGLFYLEHLN